MSSSLRCLALAGAMLCSSSALAAQQSDSIVAPAVAAALVVVDSQPRVGRLAPVRITAERRKVGRADVLAIRAENRRLEGILYRQDRQIDSLMRRLHHLRTHVTDSLNRAIADLDAETLATRARRQALEARLAAAEGATPGT